MNYELLIPPAPAEEQYAAPHIEIIDIEISQNIMNESIPDTGDGGGV